MALSAGVNHRQDKSCEFAQFLDNAIIELLEQPLADPELESLRSPSGDSG